MSDRPDARSENDLVYMVSGEDENGDTHVFVSRDKRRAEARLQLMIVECKQVKANWLD